MTPIDADPTAAGRARALVEGTSEATLSTLALDPPGTPFGSLVAFALEPEGVPLLCLSDLAEHSRNLSADHRASLMIVENVGGGPGLARGRVTLLGSCDRLPDESREAARAVYLAAHPDAFYVDFGDFAFYRMQVTQVRWVGGFGAMDWVDVAAYASAATHG